MSSVSVSRRADTGADGASLLRADAGVADHPAAADRESHVAGHRPSGEQILAALDVVVPQVKPPPAYGFMIGFLAVCLVGLSVGFVALVAFLGWLVVWHVYQSVVSLEYGPYFVFHVPMALLGGLLLLFMVKPVFFRGRGDEADVITLRPEDEPLLFAFVRKLCAATGAKAPARIEVDCDPNASARMRRGFASLVGGQLVLRIGLPLAAGLSVRQFAGVLAHEFGHFNQRSGMTGSYLIRQLTAFFAQVVFHRDRLDERLARLRSNRNAFAQLFYWIAVGLVEPARGVLWLMLLAGELLTCSVLRRMEYDADHVEAHVAGVKDFVRTSRLLMFLAIAARRARYDLADAWEQQRLADDLPRLIVANAKQLAEYRKDIFKLLDEEKTAWFDTHPCHNDRIRNVEQTGAAGLVACETPAKHLFADFGALCRRSTVAFYRGIVGDALGEAKLVPTAALAEERSGQRQTAKSLRRFFRGHVVPSRPVFPGPDAHLPAADVVAATQALAAARANAISAGNAIRPTVEQYEESSGILPAARAHVVLCDLFSFNPKAASLRAKAVAEVRKHEPLQMQAATSMLAFEATARERLTTALRLLNTDEFAPRFGDDATAAADGRRAAGQLTAVCNSLQSCIQPIRRLADVAAAIRVYMGAYDDDHPYQPLVDHVLGATSEAVDILRALQNDLALVPYPFAHGTEGVSVGAALVQKIPDAKDPADVHGCATTLLDRYCTLVFRTLSTLTEWAERVEVAAGLEAVPEPAESEDKNAEAERKEEVRNSRRYWLAYGGRATAGVAMLAGLIVLSVAPPELPSMPWESSKYTPESRVRYQPSSFRATSRNYTPPPPATFYDPDSGRRTAFYPNGYPEPPAYTEPRLPGVYYPPGHPSAVHQPGTPQPGNPRGIQPRSPYSPGYSPNTPGRRNDPFAPNSPYAPSNPGNGYRPPGGGYSPPGNRYTRPGGGRPSPGGGGFPSGGAGAGGGGRGRP